MKWIKLVHLELFNKFDLILIDIKNMMKDKLLLNYYIYTYYDLGLDDLNSIHKSFILP